jgi:hypothetical protein
MSPTSNAAADERLRRAVVVAQVQVAVERE